MTTSRRPVLRESIVAMEGGSKKSESGAKNFLRIISGGG